MHHSYIDRFAHGHSPIHALDARTKLVMLVAYTGVLVSFERLAVASLAPMLVLPVALLRLGNVPIRFALRRVVVFSPLVLAACVVSWFHDAQPYVLEAGRWRLETTGGQLTAATIALKFVLGMLALTALTGTTRFSLLLEAMGRLGVPRALVMQLGLIYRYIFVLIDQAMRVRRARDFRGGHLAPLSRRVAAAGGMVGSLMVRTLDRGHRVQLAMEARGFTGRPVSLQVLHFTGTDAAVLVATAAYLVFCRWTYPVLTS